MLVELKFSHMRQVVLPFQIFRELVPELKTFWLWLDYKFLERFNGFNGFIYHVGYSEIRGPE